MNAEQPIGPILDGLGVTIDLDDGDLVASALVIAKVVDEDGQAALSLSASDGLSWIDKNGLIASAMQILTATEIQLKGGDE